jgi:two-component system response regulator FlrC
LVISDIELGATDGMTLLSRIRDKHPGLPVILMTAYGTIQQAVTAIQEGARDYLVKPFEPEVLISHVARFDTVDMSGEDGFIAIDRRSREVMELARKVAANDVTVMITGESGTGKEVLVRFIHKQSSRSEQPFVAINCAAIPDNMLEAMLFGYQKGAFTGAYKSSPGKFEQAQGGTLLLDEISEMSLPLQAKLLRVLQEKEVERLGDQKVIELDVRVMATSNRNMRAEVEAGRFREDLFYRLNVFPVAIHPLRSRRDDILPVAEHLLAQQAQRESQAVPVLDDSARTKLLSHAWPGNVRELDNVMQRAFILQTNGVISDAEIVFEMDTGRPVAPAIPSFYRTPSVAEDREEYAECEDSSDSLDHDLRQREQQIIIDALKDASGSRKTAAEKLGISPRTLRYKLARMRDAGISIPAS